MDKEKKKKINRYNKLFLLFLFIATLFMGIGYAVNNFVDIEITGNTLAKRQEGVLITEVNYVSNVNADINNSKIVSTYKTMLNSNITLSNVDSNSSITYRVTVHNTTLSDYYFIGTDYYDAPMAYSNSDIDYTVSGINVNDKLGSNQSLSFNITFHYKNNTLSQNNNLVSYLNFKFKKKYTITYSGFSNNNYPTSIVEGDTLVLNLGPSYPASLSIKVNNQTTTNYTYQNGVLTLPNVQGDVEIKKPAKCTINRQASGVYTPGDLVTCGSDQFYVIESDSSAGTVSMLTKINVDPTSARQSYSAATTQFSDDAYWWDQNWNHKPQYSSYGSNEYFYVYDENTYLWTPVQNYKAYLINDLGLSVSNVCLIRADQLLNLGCQINAGQCPRPWLYETSYWTGSELSGRGVLLINYGFFYNDNWVSSYVGIRPVVTIDDSEIGE